MNAKKIIHISEEFPCKVGYCPKIMTFTDFWKSKIVNLLIGDISQYDYNEVMKCFWKRQCLKSKINIKGRYVFYYMSKCMRFPTMWYVRPA